MEKKIFDEICARLQDAAVITWITVTKTSPAVKTIEWFEDQVEKMLAKEVDTYPMDFPAVLVQFDQSNYSHNNINMFDGDGKVILHIVQNRMGKDGKATAATFSNFDSAIGYKDLFIEIFNGFKLPCSARLVLSGSKMDQRNRALRDDEITFNWSGKGRKESGVPGF